MSKYLFHVLIGLDAAFPLHLSWLQLEAAEMTSHVHILDTRCSRALSNSNRQEGGKGNSVLPLSCTFYLTPNLLLNEPVTEVCRAVYTGGWPSLVWVGSSAITLLQVDGEPRDCWAEDARVSSETGPRGRRTFAEESCRHIHGIWLSGREYSNLSLQGSKHVLPSCALNVPKWLDARSLLKYCFWISLWACSSQQVE